MEDALVHNTIRGSYKSLTSLNPCFNGRCTRTDFGNNQEVKQKSVLILVLMEDALVHLTKRLSVVMHNIVLILVLMEDALVRCRERYVKPQRRS